MPLGREIPQTQPAVWKRLAAAALPVLGKRSLLCWRFERRPLLQSYLNAAFARELPLRPPYARFTIAMAYKKQCSLFHSDLRKNHYSGSVTLDTSCYCVLILPVPLSLSKWPVAHKAITVALPEGEAAI